MKKLPSKNEVKKEIELNRNHSWIEEIYYRHEKDLNKTILKYWGTNITYSEFFNESYKWAKALKNNGVQKGDKIVIIMDRTPETTFLLGACSIIGAQIHLISEKFDKTFIEEKINEADSNLIFVQDVKIGYLKNVLKKFPTHKVIPVPYKRSMKKKNPYEGYTKKFYSLSENYDNDIKELKNIYNIIDFLESGESFKEQVVEKVNLDDPFTITYSSGTTKKGHPKGIVHSHRHYITMGRYHDSEVSGIPEMKNITTYSNIPVYSNSYLSSGLSDNLIQGGIAILDPIDAPEYFMTGMKFHKSNMNIATTSTWLLIAINYYSGLIKKLHINYYLKDALFNFAAGEQLSPGEERFLNKFLFDVKAGINLTHTPISICKMSTGGADCEHGSLLIRLFRAYFNKSPYRFNQSEPIGMNPYGCVDIKVLRDDGTYAKPYEYGRLVANSDCTMKEYYNDKEATKNFFIKDIYGKTWGDMNVYGYLDEKGNVTMKGRIDKNKNGIPCFLIADEISKDIKNIMSCEVVSFEHNNETVYVAHIMFQLNTKENYYYIIKNAEERCLKKFGKDIVGKLYFKEKNNQQMYPLTSSIKRDSNALVIEGLSNAIDPNLYKNQSKTKKRVLKSPTKNI